MPTLSPSFTASSSSASSSGRLTADFADNRGYASRISTLHPRHPRNPRLINRHRRAGFTLVEILASLLLMAIIVPVAMHGMSIASRAGMMGQRKAAAMRIAERVLNELIVTGQTGQSTNSGTIAEGNATYPWTLESQAWTEDPMLELTVRVTFTVQGNEYSVSTTTLIDPLAPPPTSLPEDVL